MRSTLAGAGLAGHGDQQRTGDLDQHLAGLVAIHRPDPPQQLARALFRDRHRGIR